MILEMRLSKNSFEEAVATVISLRNAQSNPAGKIPFTVHASSSSTIFYGADYDLLRVGGLLFGDPISLVDEVGQRFTLPGPHRTLLWKSFLMAVHRAEPGK